MPRTAIDLLAEKNILDASKVAEIYSIANTYSYAPIKVALCFGYLTRIQYEKFLNEQGYSFINLREQQYAEDILEQTEIHHLNAYLYLPIAKNEQGETVIVVADPFDEKLINTLKQKFNSSIKVVTASDLDITWQAHKLRGLEIVDEAVYSLYRRDPKNSAHLTFTTPQLIFIFAAIAVVLVLLFIKTIPTVIVLNLLGSIIFLFSILFKLFLALKGSQAELREDIPQYELSAVKNETLPVYTILLPVYKEDKLIRKLIWNLRGLNYPKDKLDVKLLIEEDDDKTLNAVKQLDFPANFEVIVVPFMMPKTKPKACNYGIHFSRGEFLTIYDAEDIPDTWQLKKAVLTFNKLPDEFVVLQGALNYFNRNENVLTKMFTLEYSYWFDYMLPGLETIDVPIPLGGTSNHFKMDKLVELGSWDPFNVTEDADLGVRVYDNQYKIGVINSTTYEEANNEPFNWIRQRSRWIKGYMQTYLVHMRNPMVLINKLGWGGFLGFNFFIGGTALTFLLYPILLFFFIIYLIFNLTSIKSLFPDWILYLSIFNFIAGNVLMIYINMMAVFKRRYYELILYAALNPLYWLMHSIAAYKGLWQLIVNPFYWEKTNHGLSKVSSVNSTKTN